MGQRAAFFENSNFFRQSTSQTILTTAGTQPNDDSFKLQRALKDSEQLVEDQFTEGEWLGEELFDELEELTKVSLHKKSEK